MPGAFFWVPGALFWVLTLGSAPNPSGLSPGAVPTCVLHGSYFLLLALLLAFLQVPAPPRALLLLLVLSSALGELRGAEPIGFPALTALLSLAVAGGMGFGVGFGDVG